MDRLQLEQPGMAEKIVDLYLGQGWPINRICERTGESYSRVRRILDEKKVAIRGRDSYTLRGSSHPSAKLTANELTELEAELLAGRPHGELATRYGISRERVRQIGERIGSPSGRDLQLLRRAERARERELKRKERDERRRREHVVRYEPWRRLWDNGLTVKEMAEELGLQPGAVSVRIVNLRKAHPDWFPKRRGANGSGK